MNLEALLNYVTLHSQSIIQWIFLAIVLLVGTLIAQALFGRGTSSAGAHDQTIVPSAELAATLNQILAQTASAGHAAAQTAGGGALGTATDGATYTVPSGGGADVDARLTALQNELRARDEEIAKIKATPAAGGGGSAGSSERLAELEAKLAEYEILEDDIADLSLYKEENTRLRAELEAIREGGDGGDDGGGGGGFEAAPVPSAAAPATDAPAMPARTAEAAAQAAASFAAFDEPAAAPSVAEPAPVVESAATPGEPNRHDLNEGADDLFAEFATALEESGVDLSNEAPKGETGS